MNAWGGIASLQLRLPIVWTEVRRRGFTKHDLSRWLCANPARQVSLESQKGTIAPGADADIVIWNPDAEFRVDAAALHHRHKITPYAGEVLSGVVQQTFLRGQKIYDGDLLDAPQGHMLLRMNTDLRG